MQTSALPTHLPSQLRQALDDLGTVPQGPDGAAGGDFWTQLEQLEAVAAALPEDVSVEDLTPLLAAELGGEGLPEDGSALPLPAGFGLEPDLLQPDSIEGAEGAHPLELLAAALHAAATARPAAAGEGTGEDLAALRARLGEMLAALQGGSGAPPVDARPGATAPFTIVPGLMAGGSGPETAAGALPGFSSAVLADARLSDAALAAGLPGAAAGDAAAMRGLLEARLAEAAPQAASTAGITTAPGDAATGSQPGSASAPGARIFHVDVPLQQPGWDRALGNGIRWMVNQNLQAAELKLSPPHLGPLEVRLQVDGDRTHVNIVAPQAATREAVEAALPRLREMFAESGLNLGDVNVSEDGRERGGADGSGGQGAQPFGTVDGTAGEAGAREERGVSASAQGLVDFYA